MFGLSWQQIIESTQAERIVNQIPAPINIKGVSLDSRKIRKSQAFLALKGKNFDGHDFLLQAQDKGASCLISEYIPENLSDNITIPVLIVDDTTLALGRLAKSLRLKYSPFVCAVTGSLGKTTVKDMIYKTIKGDAPVIRNQASENNQVGLPKTLLSLTKKDKVCVLELGTNHFGEISYLADICRPEIAVVTCIDDVHLRFFKDRPGVLKEKSSLFVVCPDALPILNGDDRMLRSLKTRKRPVYFGKDSGNDLYYEFKKQDSGYLLFTVNDKYTLRLNTLGRFNVYNALAALACCVCLGKSLKKSADSLSEFKFPRMRLQLKEIKGIRFINDAYNSSPNALTRALEVVDALESSRKIVVLADMLELGDESNYFHEKIVKRLATYNLDYVILLGDLMNRAGKKLANRGIARHNLFFASDINRARKHLWKIIKRDDLVLLKGSRRFTLEKLLDNKNRQ